MRSVECLCVCLCACVLLYMCLFRIVRALLIPFGLGGAGQHRAPRTKIDSNEVLREFRQIGWKPGCAAALDADTADQDTLAAVRASSPRVEVEAHARQLCAFIFAHLQLASVSMVDVFSNNLWDTVIDPAWAAELTELTDDEVSSLSSGRLQRAWRSPSLAAFVSAAQSLDLPRAGTVPAASIDPHRFPLVAMTEKKAHEVRVLAHVAAHLAFEHSIKLVVDLGSGKGYLSDALALGYNLSVLGIDSSVSNTSAARSRHSLVARLMNMKRFGEMAAPAAPGEQKAGSKGGRRRKKREVETEEGGFKYEAIEWSGEDRADKSAMIAGRAARGTAHSDADAGVESRNREDADARTASATGAFVPVTGRLELRQSGDFAQFLHDVGGGEAEELGEHESVMVVGLHTCGDLAASVLRSFKAEEKIKCVCCVGWVLRLFVCTSPLLRPLLSPPPLFSGSLPPSPSASLPPYIAMLPHAGRSGGRSSQAFHPTADSLPV